MGKCQVFMVRHPQDLLRGWSFPVGAEVFTNILAGVLYGASQPRWFSHSEPMSRSSSALAGTALPGHSAEGRTAVPGALAGGTEVPLVGGATTARSALALTLLVSMLVVDGGRPAVAHHVGAYTARDNDVSVNFKQVKFSIQAGKFDVAQRFFEDGALRREMTQRSATLPAGLEASTRAALKRGDTSGVEAALAVLFAALARDLAREAEAKLAQPGVSIEAQTAAAGRLLEAIWRYWNLVDFVINQRDAKAAAAMRLAFEEAEGATKTTTTAPVALNPCAGPKPSSGRAVSRLDPAGARAAFTRVREILSGIVETMAEAVPKPP